MRVFSMHRDKSGGYGFQEQQSKLKLSQDAIMNCLRFAFCQGCRLIDISLKTNEYINSLVLSAL